MIQSLTAGTSVNDLLIQVGALAAGIVVLKQWIRSDVTRLERALETSNKAKDADIEALDRRVSDALTRLAETVDTFIRTTTEDRFRLQEQASRWERELAIKVAALEVAVSGMSVALTRMGDTVTKLSGEQHDS